MLTGKSIRAGDVLLGLPSNGLHTNGYSLARKLLFDIARLPLDVALADELLKVHLSYLRPIRALIDARVLKGAAHITGGGITDNTPRILPKGLAARVDVSTWNIRLSSKCCARSELSIWPTTAARSTSGSA